jgi:hypothetical protein
MNKISKISLALIPVFLLLVVFCGEDSRLYDFRNVLPQDLREKFDSGRYEDVVSGLDSLLSEESAFKSEYQKLKDEEAINVFSTREVVDYYREYFLEEIKRLKRNK